MLTSLQALDRELDDIERIRRRHMNDQRWLILMQWWGANRALRAARGPEAVKRANRAIKSLQAGYGAELYNALRAWQKAKRLKTHARELHKAGEWIDYDMLDRLYGIQ